MMTVRQIERLWDERQYLKLARVLLDVRTDIDPEIVPRLTASSTPGQSASAVPASAALSIIRLDELNQNARPICPRLVRAVIATQHPDGGWGDVAVTVLALRALRCAGGDGEAIARGFSFLATLQKDDGSWPAEPIRRLSGDPSMTAFILLHLAVDPSFAAAGDVDAAVAWLRRRREEMDAPARRQADRAAARCRVIRRSVEQDRTQAASLFAATLSWS
jgi:hypothetical protein